MESEDAVTETSDPELIHDLAERFTQIRLSARRSASLHRPPRAPRSGEIYRRVSDVVVPGRPDQPSPAVLQVGGTSNRWECVCVVVGTFDISSAVVQRGVTQPHPAQKA